MQTNLYYVNRYIATIWATRATAKVNTAGVLEHFNWDTGQLLQLILDLVHIQYQVFLWHRLLSVITDHVPDHVPVVEILVI